MRIIGLIIKCFGGMLLSQLMDKPLKSNAWPFPRQTYGYLPSHRGHFCPIIGPM